MTTEDPERTIRNYLNDLGKLLRERAVQAKASADLAKTDHAHSPDEVHFNNGVSMAYFEVISLMQQQASAFGLDLKLMGLQDFDPEKELL
jgi:hypothetical protein